MKSAEKEIVILDSVDAFNKLYGLKTYNPLVSVVNLTEATEIVNNVMMDYGIYALYLKNNTECRIKYGRETYDYQAGTIVSFSPGQLIDLSTEKAEVAPDVLGLLFHPVILHDEALGRRMKGYSFFDYSQRESLHLSEDEREIVLNCFDNIRKEACYPIDKHTDDIISSQIMVLLDYISRFYDRQFQTRRKSNTDVLGIFEKELAKYYEQGRGKEGIPSVNYFATIANLTPGYFGDLIKKSTGRTAQEMIGMKLIELAKQRLRDFNTDIAIIAYDLGFQYPQHFTRMFKKHTGLTPREYRMQMN